MRQRQGLDALQPALPVGHLWRQQCVLGVGALPGGVVGIFDLQRRQRGGCALAQCRIGLAHVAQQDAVGPMVANGMVVDPQQHVFGLGHVQQADAVQARRRQVETAACQLLAVPLRFGFTLFGGQVAQVDALDPRAVRRVCPLHHLAIGGAKSGSESFVALNHGMDRFGQCVGVQRPQQPQPQGHVVGGGLRVQRLHQPHAPLRVRHRQRPVTPDLGDGRRRVGRRSLATAIRIAAPAVGQGLVNLRRQGPQRGVLEHGPQRQLDVQACAQSRQHLRGKQRMPTQLEEVVVQAEVFQVQHVVPDLPDGLFGGGARSGRCLRVCGPVRGR